MMTLLRSLAVVSVTLPLCAGPAAAQRPDFGRRPAPPRAAPVSEPIELPNGWQDAMQWRSIGPALMGGRITDIAVHPGDQSTWWIATASGGVLKTTNDGNTFEHQFTDGGSSSVGAIAVAPSDPDVVWIGTGERNPRNSVSWGDGVYKSIDGGASWTKTGLEESFQIGSIVIDPTDSNIVYVGALGRLWGENDQRGLYKTVDGGETWELLLQPDTRTGVVDIVMHPDDPSTLLVATYERERDPFCTNDPSKKWGPGSALYRTTDGGRNFERITSGLPSGTLGRIGLDWYPKESNVVFMVLEAERISQEPENAPWVGVEGEDAEVGARVTKVVDKSPAAEAGLKAGDIVLSVDGHLVHSYQDMLDRIRRHVAGEVAVVVASRDRQSVECELALVVRPEEKEDSEESADAADAADVWKSPYPDPGPFRGTLGGQAANFQHQQGPDGHEFGGVYKSTDAGLTWTRINSLNPRPMYYSEVRVDPSDQSRLYVLGTSLHRSKDGGETFTPDGHDDEVHVDHHALWIDPTDGRHMILGNDGGIYVTHDRMENWDHHNHVAIGQFYHVTTDTAVDYKVYGGLQDNGSWGGPSRTRSGAGPVNDDWINIGGGDGFICRVDPDDPDQIYSESQNGGMGTRNLRTGARGFLRPRPERGQQYRFNWRTPYLLSSHNSRIFYTAGNYVFRSLNKGENLKRISPEISRTNRGSATALAESPRDEDELWVGTDDGALWSTHDGGTTWRDLFEGRVIEESAPAADPDPSSIAASNAGESESTSRGTLVLADGEATVENHFVADEAADATIEEVVEEPVLESPAKAVRAASSSDERDAQAAAALRGLGYLGASDEGEAAGSADATSAQDHPLVGLWIGEATGGELEPGEGAFELEFTLSTTGELRADLTAVVGQGPFQKVEFDAKSSRLTGTYDADGMLLEFDGKFNGEILTGTIDFAQGAMTLDFVATPKTPRPAPAGDVAPAAEAAPDEPAVAGGDASAQESPETDVAEAPREGGRRGRRGGDGDAKGDEQPKGPSLAELVPTPHRVSELVASRHVDDRVYVSFDGHRTNDDLPHVFTSDDGGDSWRSIRGDLPDEAGSVRTIEEDLENPNLLYLGCEFGLYVSLDRGLHWTRLHSNLPTVPVHAIAQAPAVPEIVAGTHGRSLWVLDVSALRQMTPEILAKDAHLFTPGDAWQWRREPQRGSSGTRRFVGENPRDGARIDFLLGRGVRSVELVVTGPGGTKVRDFEVEPTAGLHSIEWDLREAPPAGTRSRWRRGRLVAAGQYQVELTVDGTTERATLDVHLDPASPEPAYLEFQDFEEVVDEDEGPGEPVRRVD